MVYLCLLAALFVSVYSQYSACVDGCLRTYTNVCIPGAGSNVGVICTCLQNVVNCLYSCPELSGYNPEQLCASNSNSGCNFNCNRGPTPTPTRAITPTSTPVSPTSGDYSSICSANGPSSTNCNYFSSCLERYVPCGNSGYALGYGSHYCSRFLSSNSLSNVGNQWKSSMENCIQSSFAGWLSSRDGRPSCEEITSFGFNVHVACFLRPTSSVYGICDIPSDWLSIFQLAGRGTESASDRLVGWTQLWDITKQCPNAYGRRLSEILIRTSVTPTVNIINDILSGIATQLNIPRSYLDYLSFHSTSKRSGGEVVVSVVDVEQSGLATKIVSASSRREFNALSVNSIDNCNEPCYSYSGAASLNSVFALFAVLLVSLQFMA